MTEDLINQLIESTSDQVHIIHIVSADASFRVVFPEKLCSGDILLASETLVDNSSINCSVTKIRFGSCLGLACCRNIPFGYHHWCASFRIDGIDDSTAKVIEAKGQILCSSLLYDFLSSSDDLLEEFVWGWSYGGLFTDALESSLLELLIANNDELEATVRSWKPMMSAFNGMEQETSRLVDMIRSDLSVALTLKNKAGYAIGRLHQNLLQLMDSGNGLLGLPQIFTDACKSFLMLKLTTAPQSVLNDRIKVTLPHVQSFINSTICGDLERTRLKGSLSCMRRFSSDASPVIGMSYLILLYQYDICFEIKLHYFIYSIL